MAMWDDVLFSSFLAGANVLSHRKRLLSLATQQVLQGNIFLFHFIKIYWHWIKKIK